MKRHWSSGRRQPSALEETLAFQLKAAGLPEFEREYRFCPDRRYRADFAWPDRCLLVECEGGVFARRGWGGGWHQSIAGYLDDCRKYSLAALSGYWVLRYTSREIEGQVAIREIEAALKSGIPVCPETLRLLARTRVPSRRSRAWQRESAGECDEKAD
jgi:very-short-patch-repair endonuclease